MVSRRLLDEGTWGDDFLMRMRSPSGSFFRSIARDKAFDIVSERRTIELEYRRSSYQFGEASTAAEETVTDLNYEASFRSGGGFAIAALAAGGGSYFEVAPGRPFHHASDAGRILFDGVDVEEVPPAERRIGMVFQDYALYPNMDSRANVLSYFLFKERTPELDAGAADKYRRAAELLGVDIEKLMDRMPRGLSGGEQRRVAVARCITRDPRLFLLDEPFSSLDQKLREKYRSQLRILLKQFGITTVYVTHDQVEALILAADFINFEPEMPSINLLDGAAIRPELAGYAVGARPGKRYALGTGTTIIAPFQARATPKATQPSRLASRPSRLCVHMTKRSPWSPAATMALAGLPRRTRHFAEAPSAASLAATPAR